MEKFSHHISQKKKYCDASVFYKKVGWYLILVQLDSSAKTDPFSISGSDRFKRSLSQHSWVFATVATVLIASGCLLLWSFITDSDSDNVLNLIASLQLASLLTLLIAVLIFFLTAFYVRYSVAQRKRPLFKNKDEALATIYEYIKANPQQSVKAATKTASKKPKKIKKTKTNT